VTSSSGPRPPARRNDPKTLAQVAVIGATTTVLAYWIGRGTIVGMVAVFAVVGIGSRLWARWYRRRHHLR
jgi:uncharacterized membrane protein YjjB (DUF3815 family)